MAFDRRCPRRLIAFAVTVAVATTISCGGDGSKSGGSCSVSRPLPQRYTEPGNLSARIDFVQTACSIGIVSIETRGESDLLRKVVFTPPLPAGSLDAKVAAHWDGTGKFRGTSHFSGPDGVVSLTQEGTYKATATIVLTEAFGGPVKQWATDATASSEFASAKWAADQATGGPTGKAWAPSSMDGTSEWLELTYPQAVIPTGIDIWESRGGGFITKVETFDPVAGSWVKLWEGTDPTTGSPAVFSPPLPKTAIQSNRMRLTVDTNVPDWNEVDAVALIGAEPATGEVIWLQGGWDETGKETVCLAGACESSPLTDTPTREWNFAFNTATGKVGTTPDQVR